ncbi:HAD family hydrolase [Streptomyces sp. MA5143a]|uniref:HAD family hydrolase n=1 Tax=Streptomyces sp. MA5143a TaxID=2083010 RepID=UPI000D19F7E8|nr:HAD-IA family hydrolase [Streptomyces sp. MA5143a]SPF04635.1 Phosphoglycolate phosphatase [Streptomyces sp. MA5143a]
MIPTPDTQPVAVLFDAADTLIELSPAIPELLSATWLGTEGAPSAAAVRAALWEIGTEGGWPDDESDPVARLETWTRFCREALVRGGGIDSAPAARRAAQHILAPENYHCFPDVPHCLERLRVNGHQLGLVSNFDPWLHDILSSTGLAPWFDTIVVSSEVGQEKPDPAIFALACERLGRMPPDCLFVGDSVAVDVEGASGAGLHPVLLDRYGRFPDFPGTQLATLDSLPTLAAQFKEGNPTW